MTTAHKIYVTVVLAHNGTGTSFNFQGTKVPKPAVFWALKFLDLPDPDP